MSVPRKTPSPTQKGCIWGYLVFHSERLEPRALLWQQYSRCHFVSFVMYITGAKFEDHCSNISGDILNSVFYCFSGTIYDVITSLICIIQKPEHLYNEKRYSKKENTILLYFEKPSKQAVNIFYFTGTLTTNAKNVFASVNIVDFKLSGGRETYSPEPLGGALQPVASHSHLLFQLNHLLQNILQPRTII